MCSHAMKINFNPEQFNDLHFQLTTGKKRFQVTYGGAGAGKSHSIDSNLLVERAFKYSDERILVIRKVGNSLRDSVISLTLEYLHKWEDETGFNFIKQYNKNDATIELFNGAMFIFKGMDDDARRLKSINGITCIWVEEADELTLSEMMQLNTRLRGKGLRDPKFYISFNPVSELSYLKTHFFDNESVAKKCDYYHVTYLDNKFIDEAYKKELEDYLYTDENYYNIYTKGNWGSLAKDSIIYKKFEITKHVVADNSLKINDEYPIWLSIDENYVPTSSVIVFQVIDNHIKIIDEIFEIGWELEKVCAEVENRYGKYPKILTGDASAKGGTSKLDRGVNTYTLIEKYITGIEKNIVPSVNPSIKFRTKWINDILFTDKIQIRINAKCKNLINDLLNVKWDKDNKGKDKSVFKDKKHNMSYQKYGHLTDCFDYALTSAYRKQYDIYGDGTKRIQPTYRASNAF